MGGLYRSRSGRLRYQDWVELEALDAHDRPRRGISITFELADGSVRTVATDSRGVARLDGVPPGRCEAIVPFPSEGA